MSEERLLAAHSGEAPLAEAEVARLLGGFGIDEPLLARLNALGLEIRRQAPDLIAPLEREATLAHAESAFFAPILAGTMSAPQKAMIDALSRGRLGLDALCALLARWALAVNPQEPAERVRRDCLPLQDALRAGALRVYAEDAARREAALAAAEHFTLAQLAVCVAAAASGAARGAAAGALPEHVPLVEQLRKRIARCAQDGRALALIYVECGIIGRIDGIWGFHVGDAVRTRILARMRTDVLRPGDLLSEVGRDEFACVLDVVAGPGVAMLAAQKTLRALNVPVRVAETEVYARPAVGLALYPEHGESPATLLQRAKIACLVARDELERIAVYQEKQEDPHTRMLVYENRLRAAIDQGALELVFQPQFRLADGALVGVESLLRWKDSELGVVPPSQAIAVAESAGLMNEVTWWVLNNALRHCAEFRFRGLDIRVGVNLSANNLRERDLPDFIDRALRTWDVPASSLVIEVTETAVLGGAEAISDTFGRLKALGVRLSIDDFGTGYSSMNYLANMPFDEMKIDLSFVRDMVSVPAHERIVRSLIDLAHNLGLTVVAEGVESEPTRARLAELGCDCIQGYFASEPLEPEKLLAAYARGR
jgi:diguanylate cyclase (GGDEF)-like protein